MKKEIETKILFLNYEYPPLWGGAWVCTKYQAEELAKFGYHIVIVTTWFPWQEEYEKKWNIEIIRLKSKRKYIHKSWNIEKIDSVIKTLSFLNKYLQENHIDLCIWNFSILGWTIWYQLKKKYNIPYVVISHWHDIPWFFKEQMFYYHLVTYFFIKKICKKAERIILLTNDMKKNADAFLPKEKEKHIIIPNGYDTAFFYQDTAKKSKKFSIIFVWRLVKQKDPLTFLKAIKTCKDTYSFDFEVQIYGDGPLLETMKQYVFKNNLESLVHFNGWVGKDTILEAYQTASLQVITSKAEAMSIATLESLATGLYILSTPVSGNTDVIQQWNNGDFFEIWDYKTLADKIYSYYKDTFSKNEENTTILIDMTEYSWKNIWRKYHTLIQELLNK